MPFINRRSFIALLDSLGDPDDAAALAAAREVDRRMREAGASWDDLLVPAPTAAAADPAPEVTAEPAALDDDAAWQTKAGGETDAAMIDRLLAGYDLSDETRQELLDLKGDIAAGEFTAADAKYVRDLAARLAR